MTVVVYRNEIMAADSGGRANDVILNNVTKVFKCPVSGDLYGFAGNADSMSEFINFVKSTYSPKIMPPIPKGNEEYGRFIVLHVSNLTGKARLLTHYGEESYANEPYVAIGAGAEVAIGALHAGATAIEAAQAAIKHSPYCFGGVVYQRLPKVH